MILAMSDDDNDDDYGDNVELFITAESQSDVNKT